MAWNCDTHIVWLDTELTTLNLEITQIVEVACFVTDKDLNVISTEFNVVIHHSDETLNNMNEWSTEHHEKTGLINESRSSTVTLKEAELMLLNFIKKYIAKGVCPLAGNSIYMDALVLRNHMPSVIDYLHYRLIDVSTIKELARWYPSIYKNGPEKRFCHRALQDIENSLQELKYYQQHIFLAPSI